MMFQYDLVLGRYSMFQMADMVDWNVFEEKLSPMFYDDNSRSELPGKADSRISHCLIFSLSSASLIPALMGIPFCYQD